MAEQKVGTVVHYWGKIGVAGIRITEGELRVGDTIHVKGHTSDFTQQVESIHKDNAAVEVAVPGMRRLRVMSSPTKDKLLEAYDSLGEKDISRNKSSEHSTPRCVCSCDRVARRVCPTPSRCSSTDVVGGVETESRS